jgi:hypothetical protein
MAIVKVAPNAHKQDRISSILKGSKALVSTYLHSV